MSTTVQTSTDTPETRVAAERTAFASGLRKLADLLEQHPELELPYTGHAFGAGINWIPLGGDGQKAQAATFARLIPGKVDKAVRGEAFDLIGSIDGLRVKMIVDRDEVCERVVVGTETIEVTEPDPEAVAALPTVTRTEVHEIVEWRCGSLLGGGDDA